MTDPVIQSTPSHDELIALLDGLREKATEGPALNRTAKRMEFYEALAAAYPQLKREREEMREALRAAIRAAKLALFVIRKQGVMPNTSWETGFNSDLAKAEAALSSLQGDK